MPDVAIHQAFRANTAGEATDDTAPKHDRRGVALGLGDPPVPAETAKNEASGFGAHSPTSVRGANEELSHFVHYGLRGSRRLERAGHQSKAGRLASTEN